jgi:hypothetical protein
LKQGHQSLQPQRVVRVWKICINNIICYKNKLKRLQIKFNWLAIHKRSPPKLLTIKDVKVEPLEVEGVKLKGVNGAKTFEL